MQVRAREEERRAAHQAAAAYWRWRDANLPGSLQQKIEDVLEARYHYQAAGELSEAVKATEAICSYLDKWGAWEREEAVLLETLAWLPETSAKAADFYHQLGLVAQHRGDYNAALRLYRHSLAIFEQVGAPAGMAKSFHHLSILAREKGNHGVALCLARKALQTCRLIDEPAGRARCYHQVGMVAQARRRYNAALAWYRAAFAIFQRLDDQAGIAVCYGQLGVLAAECDEPKEALGLFDEARVIFKAHRHRVSMAQTYCQIGKFFTDMGDAVNGLRFQAKSFKLHMAIASPEIGFDLHNLARQRGMLGADEFRALLIEHLGEEGAATVEHWLQRETPG